MTEDDSDERSGGTWFGRLRQVIRGDTATREDLLQLLRDAHGRTVLDADELAMLEGVLAVSEMQVRDVMVPRSQMVVLERDASREEILKTIVESGHSRFPLIGTDREEVVGILLAKDVLRYFVETPDQTSSTSRAGCVPPPSFRRASGSTGCSRICVPAAIIWPSSWMNTVASPA